MHDDRIARRLLFSQEGRASPIDGVKPDAVSATEWCLARFVRNDERSPSI